MSYFLDDLTVIDAATFLAGPGAATILADYGANVIKIEPPRATAIALLWADIGPISLALDLWEQAQSGVRSE